MIFGQLTADPISMPYEEPWGLVLIGRKDKIPKGFRGHGEAVTFV